MSASTSGAVKAQPMTAYSPEEAGFHRTFPDIPETEKLVETCQCGVMKKKLVRMGRLYVTSLRMCFTSAFLEMPIMLPWEDVISVEKRSNFVFDDIVVKSHTEGELQFTTFIAGGTAQMFKLMKTLWSVRERYATSERAASEQAVSVRNSVVVESPREFGTPRLNAQAPQNPLADECSEETNESKSTHGADMSVPSGASSTVSSSRAASPVLDPRTPRPTPTRANRTFEAEEPHLDDEAQLRSVVPDLPETEHVSECFQCSYVSGVHRLGKLYITNNSVFFFSVMLDGVIKIPFASVASIEKEQTMMILDGISIKLTAGKTFSFTNFVSRDAVFNVLSVYFTAAKSALAGTAENKSSGPIIFATSTSKNDENKVPTFQALDDFSKVATQYGTAFSDASCFTKEIMQPLELPAGRGIMDLFGLCFDDDTPMLTEYHTKRGDTNQKLEHWRPASNSAPFCGQRQFTCTTLVRAMMNKPYDFIEYQRYAIFKMNDALTLAVQFSSQVPGVMFGDAFRAESLAVFTQAGNGEDAKVTMRAYGYVQFLKSVWVKGKINSTSLNQELPESYKIMSDLVMQNVRAYSRGASGAADLPTSAVAPSAESAIEVKMHERPFAPLLSGFPSSDNIVINYIQLGLYATAACFSAFGFLRSIFGRAHSTDLTKLQHTDIDSFAQTIAPAAALFFSVTLFATFQLTVSFYLALL